MLAHNRWLVDGCGEFRIYLTLAMPLVHLLGVNRRLRSFDRLRRQREEAARRALEAAGVTYTINEGDGAFYGPKIDFDVSDSIGRKWQLGTIQLDYAAPERFDLHYVGEDNEQHRPVVIHRAIFGSFERFIAILIEHFGGAFPVDRETRATARQLERARGGGPGADTGCHRHGRSPEAREPASRTDGSRRGRAVPRRQGIR